MTEHDLKKLSRTDLLEILLEQGRELEAVKQELEEVKEQLENRVIVTERVGSLAEAALELNGVFEATQKACEQYIINIRNRGERQERILDQIEKETKEDCARMRKQAKREAEAYRADVVRRLREVFGDDPRVSAILEQD